jgi:23S rRNA pseudouridine955/2504/2580 synthase
MWRGVRVPARHAEQRVDRFLRRSAPALFLPKNASNSNDHENNTAPGRRRRREQHDEDALLPVRLPQAVLERLVRQGNVRFMQGTTGLNFGDSPELADVVGMGELRERDADADSFQQSSARLLSAPAESLRRRAKKVHQCSEVVQEDSVVWLGPNLVQVLSAAQSKQQMERQRLPLSSARGGEHRGAETTWKPTPRQLAALAERIVHSDGDVAVLNKPAGLACQGGPGVTQTVDAYLSAGLLRNEETGERARLVHRLDRDTSGVLLLARSRRVAMVLVDAIRESSEAARARSRGAKGSVPLVEKTYLAVVRGTPKEDEGRLFVPLAADSRTTARAGGESGSDRSLVVVAPRGGKMSVTSYEVLGSTRAALGSADVPHLSLVQLAAETGRKHQLRVACASVLQAPIVGDRKYGWRGSSMRVPLHLHARSLRFSHPVTGQDTFVDAPLPTHMARTLRAVAAQLEPEVDLGDLFEK